MSTIETICTYCGYKSCDEVKCIDPYSDIMKVNNGSPQITPGAKGTRICFKITGLEDLKRRLVKVRNAGVKHCYSSYIWNIFQIQ